MKNVFIVFSIVLGLGICGYSYYRLSNSLRVKMHFMKSEMKERSYEPVLGIYDRHKIMDEEKIKNARHFVLRLNNDDEWEIPHNPLVDVPTDAPVILTVELWDIDVLGKVSRGFYDNNIEQFFSGILKNRKNVFLRWNPEMEVPVRQYPWEINPAGYLEAFSRFSKIIKEVSPATQMVYAPAGYPGLLESYPGKESVDATSITINSTSESFTEKYKEETVQGQLARKLHRLRFIDHPVIILGSQNLDLNTYRDDWLQAAVETIENNSDIIYSSNNFIHPHPKNFRQEEEFQIGFFDPGASLLGEKEVTVEHIFLNFTEVETGEFDYILEEALCRDNYLILTVEPGIPWNDVTDNDILNNILKGKYDEVISKFYSIISEVNRKIYLRFAHEMDIPITRYSWQSKEPIEYINAYRYFMQFPGYDIPNVKKIWGPAGDRGALEWYPGDDVVDYMSIAIYGLPDKNITDPEKQETFKKIFTRKARRLRFVDKPIFITEFGVKGDEDFQAEWLVKAAHTINEEPQVIGVNYFNMTDVPKAWGEIQPPDWSISKETFSTFLEALHRDDLQTAENLN